MEVIGNPGVMQQTVKEYLQRGNSIGFVPTMGALHEGHLSLVRRCREENDISVVSIFVNPMQFGPSGDFSRYPRNVEEDMAELSKAGVDILFMPGIEDIYPEGFATYVNVDHLSDKLCGHFRPGHFRGVATVVTKLLNIARPARAYFGRKDFQQFLIIKQLVRDLNLDTETVICPTVREADGLAMSSRNQYLSPEERNAATVIYRTLCAAKKMVISEKITFGEIRSFMERTLAAEPLVDEVQYASAFDPGTLEDISSLNVTIDKYEKEAVLLAIAVRIGSTRLIDNEPVEITGIKGGN
ncbi:MAG TPA: pantoate--beta-alanine ligase [Nitrospirae bacterium]|nr:pantoate--beta-alanine ligase [Nitrospirota bacterium]